MRTQSTLGEVFRRATKDLSCLEKSAMRLLIVGDFAWNNGSSHVIREYVKHAPALGIEVALSAEFGSHDEEIARELPYCENFKWATHMLVVFESNPFLSTKDLELIDRVIPRSRRAVVDADGHWSPLM